MGTKNNPAPNDCYALALDDEPMFVLLARDLSAPAIVSAWADRRLAMIRHNEAPESDIKKVQEALGLANAMREWRKKNLDTWRSTPLFPDLPHSPPCDCSACQQRTKEFNARNSPPTPAEGWPDTDKEEIPLPVFLNDAEDDTRL